MNFSFLRPLALPRPATIRAFLSTATSPSTAVPKAIPLISTTTSATAKATFTPLGSIPAQLPYHVSRTGSNQLPIYLLRKRGGNLHQTKLRRIEGDVLKLRQELEDYLGAESKDVVVNSLTRQIIVRGHRKTELTKFLVERKF